MKLYRVTLKGMTYNPNGIAYGISYVVAEDTENAYQKVKQFLDKENYGFSKDRELDKIELIADVYRYNNCGCLLYL